MNLNDVISLLVIEDRSVISDDYCFGVLAFQLLELVAYVICVAIVEYRHDHWESVSDYGIRSMLET
jgi:hypothetical protein